MRYFFGQLLSEWYMEIRLLEKQTQAIAYFGISEAQYVEVAVWSKALASYVLRWEKEVTQWCFFRGICPYNPATEHCHPVVELGASNN